MPEKGDVRPSFEEEVFARSQAVKVYNEVLARDPGCADSYWSTLAAVEAQGFMKAYVWTHHHRYDWPDKSQPRDLAKFRKWQKKNLKKHVPQTPVILEMQEEAGEKVRTKQGFWNKVAGRGGHIGCLPVLPAVRKVAGRRPALPGENPTATLTRGRCRASFAGFSVP
ncbi:MAG: hypothetical protein IPN11_06630 [Opitutaceae bacterium]|nr:hypothetical protein [Opitutaceae bacterium]